MSDWKKIVETVIEGKFLLDIILQVLAEYWIDFKI